MLLCDNCHHRENTVTGRGEEPTVRVLSLDGQPYSHAAGIIRFPSTMPKNCAKRTLCIQNTCSAPLPFRWAINSDVQLMDASTPATDSIRILPENGVIAPWEEMLFDAVFSPICCGMCAAVANFEMDPSAAGGAGEEAGAPMRRIQLRLEGFAPIHPASVYPRVLRAPEVLEVGSTSTQSFIIRNPADVAAHFSITGAAEGAVAVSAQAGTVAARSQLVVQVLASASEALDVQQTLTCHVEHGLEYAIHVCATFAVYLPAQLHTAGVDFGLVGRGSAAVATFQLRNPSLFNAAPWSVSCVAPAVRAAAVVEAPVCSGVLQPQECWTVELHCAGVAAGALQGHARVSSHSDVMLVPFRVTVMAPHIILGPTTDSFDLGTVYLGVAVTRQLELINDANVAARWKIRPSLMGTGADTVQILGLPDSGALDPGARQQITLTVTAQCVDSVNGLLVIDVDHAEQPLVVPVSCTSESLRVEYSIAHGAVEGEDTSAAACTAEPLGTGVINFGDSVTVGDVVALQLILTNPTGIEASVEVGLEHFAATDNSISRTQGGDNASNGVPGNGSKPRLLLGDEHEWRFPFRAQAGQDLLATRALQV